ncbi:MAG: hypothetical protein IJW73_09705 [Candidatus Gastranaerophilales bacterium]|nr:hypothetical protein [Candidatus Gastranaerophilales bacterium]
MKINPANNQTNFKGFYNNKFFLKSLEKIADHSGSFTAGASFVCATLLRPIAINLAPDVKKENKKALSAESIASGVVKLGTALAISLPIEGAIKKINKKPQEYFSQKTLKNLDKKSQNFIEQTIKQSSNVISAIPKSLATIALMPILLNAFSKSKEKNKQKQGQVNFKGLDKRIAKIIENDNVQKFAQKHSPNSKNIARNTAVVTDILLATSSIIATKTSKKIDEKTKKPLMINKALSTAISIIAGCAIDSFAKKATGGIVEKFIQENKNDPKLLKYLDGINVLRPTIIFAGVYYFLIPIITTLISDKLSNQNNENKAS